MDVLLLHPPATKPAEPPLGVAVLLGHLRQQGIAAEAIDANLGAYLYLLDPRRLAAAAGAQPPTRLKRAVAHAESALAFVRSPRAGASFARYSTAVRHLDEALSAFAGAAGTERLTLGDYTHGGLSEFAPEDLERVTRGEAATLFSPYFREELIPRAAALRPRIFAISINFRHQVLPAFELAGLLRRAFPEALIVGGGGMLGSWKATLSRLGLRFSAFDRIVFGPGERPLAALASGSAPPDYFLEDAGTVSFEPDYSFAALPQYLSPEPVLPMSATRGCYWRRCLFCPEHAAPTEPYRCSGPDCFAELLLHLSRQHGIRRFHLTDNALPANVLSALAARSGELAGLSWHGFVRFERALLDEQLVDGLARAGCSVLQLGLESGSQPVLDRLGKGTRLDEVSAILANLARAGVGTYVYVMFGTPGETQADAERTLAFLEQHADRIGWLNLAIMNLPRDASLLDEAAEHGIAQAPLLAEEEPLGLYRRVEPAGEWGRAEARRFLKRRVLASPRIKQIVARTPPLFTSHHAFFFHTSPRGL